MIWIKFYHPDGRDLGGYTLLGTFAGELQNTKELLAAENGIKKVGQTSEQKSKPANTKYAANARRNDAVEQTPASKRE